VLQTGTTSASLLLTMSEAEALDQRAFEDEDSPDAPKPLKLRLLRFVPMIVVLGLAVHVILPRVDSIEDSLETMKTLAPWALGLAVVAEGLSYVANGSVLQSVIRLAGDKLPLRRAIAIELAAGSVALVAAGALGFGAAIYKWTQNRGVSRNTAMLASWLPSMFDAASLVVFALAGAVELLLVHQLSRPTEVALFLVVSALAAVIAAVIVLLAKSDWAMALARRATRLLQRFRATTSDSALTDSVKRASETWSSMKDGGWIRPAVSSILVLTFDVVCLELAFLAAGQRVHPTLLLAGYGVPMLLGRASFLPGGIAVIEIAMTAIFGGLGVPANAAVVAVLTYRLISFWLPALLGIPLAIRLQSKGGRIAPKPEPGQAGAHRP
jgi:uncharacterized protein (TIRG00374 family)